MKILLVGNNDNEFPHIRVPMSPESYFSINHLIPEVS